MSRQGRDHDHSHAGISFRVRRFPQLTQTEKGDARLYFRFGQEHFRKEDDGSFTQLETTFHHLVMFGRSANHAHDRFRKGDNFIAEGYTRSVNYEREGEAVASEEFTARKIGHDTARTRYEVDRSPRRNGAEQAAPARGASAFTSPEPSRQATTAPAMGM